MAMTEQVQHIFQALLAAYGPRSWWPAETPFEVCVGAILTQNTNWSNVEKAIANLRRAGLLTPAALLAFPLAELAALIRPAGYFNVKSARLQDFVRWLHHRYGGSLDTMFRRDWQLLRQELLAVRGIGPETADSILLYAGHKPTFVVDAYTRRLFCRLGLLATTASYDATRELFMAHLPTETALYNEYHALIVEHGKEHCRTKPRCNCCPLLNHCCFVREFRSVTS
jgi:endonuclease III related protein